MEATPTFFNRVAATYGEFWTIEEETRWNLAELVRGVIARPASGPGRSRPPLILEAGCGNGRQLCNLPPGAIGLDFSPEMLREARARCPSARLVLGSALALPFRPHSFAIAVAANVIHNHADPEPMLRELTHVAEHLAVDFRNRINPIVAWKAWRWRAAKFIRYTARAPWSWRRLLARTGWAVARRRAVARPIVDPGTGFRWAHLVGAVLSRIPGFAPVEVWVCVVGDEVGD